MYHIEGKRTVRGYAMHHFKLSRPQLSRDESKNNERISYGNLQTHTSDHQRNSMQLCQISLSLFY